MAEDITRKDSAQTEQQGASPAQENDTERKPKRVRRTNDQIAADKQKEEEERRAIIIEELRAQGLIKNKEDEDDYVNRNLEDYNRLRRMPDNACKRIDDGPLEGKTDINPMARIKMLTAVFGPYGSHWRCEIVKSDVIGSGDDQMVSVLVALYVKKNGEWLAPSYGFGGSTFFNKGNHQYGVDDDCFKKAATDAFGVACKNFGMAADVYYAADANYETKYDTGGSGDGKGSFSQVLQNAGAPITPQPQAPAAPAKDNAEEKSEEKPAVKAEEKTPAAPAPATPAPTPAPEPSGLTVLTENSRSYVAVFTHICGQKDKSAPALARIRERYRTEKHLEIPDELWNKMIETATAA